MTQNPNQIQAGNQPTQKDEKISPLIEMTLVLLVKIAEYLKVYATDVKVQDSRYYKEAQKSLKDAVTNLSKLLGLGPEFFAHVFSDKSLTDLIATKTGATPTSTTPQSVNTQTASIQETTPPQTTQATDANLSQSHDNVTTFTTELLPPSEKVSSADIAMTDDSSQNVPSQDTPTEATQQAVQTSQPADTTQNTPLDQTTQSVPDTQNPQDTQGTQNNSSDSEDDISKLLEQLDQLAKKGE